MAWTAPAGPFDALLVGSASAFRLGGASLDDLRHLPVHAVGETTAAAARDAGFEVARTGVGGLQLLLDRAEGETRRFLRLAGEERVILRPHPGQSLAEVTVYRMVPRHLSEIVANLLRDGHPIVALHSAAAATHFSQEVDRLGLTRGKIFLLALGPRIAKAAGLGWAAVHIAENPSDAALLAKAAALCK